MNRYDWEDALIDAQTAGQIPNGALLVALKLARAINWSPKDKRPAGLYWKNEDALKSVGAGRATYFTHRQSLVETGFIRFENGNLLPTIPEKSLVETKESPVETTESLVETEKSLGDNPFSEDTFSEDVCSEEHEVTTVPDGPVVAVREEPEDIDPLLIALRDDGQYWFNGKPYVWKKYAEEAKRDYEVKKVWNDEDM